MSDLDWLREKGEEERRRTAEAIDRAKDDAARSGKEPFDYDKLITMYDPTSDMSLVIYDPAEAAAYLEEKYYVQFPKVMSLAEFARLLEELRSWG